MRHAKSGTRTCLIVALSLSTAAVALAQDGGNDSTKDSSAGASIGLIVGHPFSAIKYAKRVRELPDGTQRFITNERYPTQIARDPQGRLMMQVLEADGLPSECDHLRMKTPPVCPVWGIIVVDPVAHLIAHWPEGEVAAHVAIDMPLTDANLERSLHSTSEMPALPADFSSDRGELTTVDLGTRIVDGIRAHGVKTTLVEFTGKTRKTRIHEVWTAPEMKLIVRVVDGDPSGLQTIRGLEKVSLQPDSALFQAPEGYKVQHQDSDKWAEHDFENLETWYEE
jgi:hypothetical protein